MNSLNLSFSDRRIPLVNSSSSGLLWLFSLMLLTFMALVQLMVFVAFALHLPAGWAILPIAILLTSAVTEWFARKEGHSFNMRLLLPIALVLSTLLAVAAAKAFYDMSWDGLWYHQTAVYQMAHGWNPDYDSMHGFVDHLRDWVRHYAKGPWYLSLAFYQLTGDIEMAKVGPWLTFIATISAVLALCIELGMNRWQAGILALFTAANPVAIFELPSYLVDGMMVSFMAIFVSAVIRWFRTPSAVVNLVMLLAVILCVNAKQTGLVYLCFAIAAILLYLLFTKRELLLHFIAMQAAAMFFGLMVFGFNPYVTNLVHRGNPLYPMLGSTSYPSLSQRGEDPIEQWETPFNMMGKNRFTRLAYAIFGRPGAQPYYPGQNASFMLPFQVSWKDFQIYYFHDVRISGFGPLFSGILLLSFLMLAWIIYRQFPGRLFLLLAVAAILVSLLISIHTWWARYGPQLWWIPLLIIGSGYLIKQSRALSWFSSVLLLLLVINTLPIAMVHFGWEYEATKTTREQLELLKTKRDIRVDFQFFGEPFGERLRAAGIQFRPVQKLEGGKQLELMSVSPGYPCAVHAAYYD